VVFKLGPTGTETVLYSFTGAADGGNPFAGLVRDTTGSLYGTTFEGGANSSACDYFGNPTTCGVVFKLSLTGTETVLHSFTGSDGGNPWAGLLRDTAGNLYGTTANGGAFGNGVVFELIRCDTAASGYEFKVLHSFTGGADGGHPLGSLLRDAAGNLYGTTVNGGAKSSACTYFFGNTTCGVVFKLSPTGTETVLHTFTGGAEGGNPYYAGLIPDATGNLYGTTAVGGAHGVGVVFRLTP
jgi:uncharacterized repeat protein (TIGR03803 family)